MRRDWAVLAAAAGAALVAVAAVGVGGMYTLDVRTTTAAERREASLSTLMLVAGVRDQLRLQQRAGNQRAAQAESQSAENFESHNLQAQAAIAQLGGPFGAQDARRIGEAHRDWVNAVRTGDTASAPGLESALFARLERLSRGALGVANRDALELAAASRDTLRVWIGLLALTVIAGIALTIMLGLRLARGMRDELGGEPAALAAIARALARGQFAAADALPDSTAVSLRDRLDPYRGGDLAGALKLLARGMQGLVEDVRGNAAQLAQVADTLVSSAAQVASGSNVQAEAAAGMASSVSQMAASITQVSEHSHTALRISRESGELSEQASSVVAGASGELEGVARSAGELTEIIHTLGERSVKISGIVSVIQDIANQTNLLALNAAIEAARAGEQGRGFSVVADEVRKLADRTTESTREISEMIQAIQQGTGEAVKHMEKWGASVTGGVCKAQGAGVRMEKIRSGTRDVIEAVDRVSGALAEQSGASDEIAAAVLRIAAISKEGSASAGAMSGSAQAVARLAASISAIAAQFQAVPARA